MTRLMSQQARKIVEIKVEHVVITLQLILVIFVVGI